MNFDRLVQAVEEVYRRLESEALKAVNRGLTLRNWLIGFYIVAYEQDGSDRAAYGERLLDSLAGRLHVEGLVRVDPRELRRYRQFCLSYPQIRETLSPEFSKLLGLGVPDLTAAAIPLPRKGKIRETVSPGLAISADTLLDSLSFSHFVELLSLGAPLKRAFYEIECIKGGWSVRELKRQIASLYYERSGLSRNKAELSRLANEAAEISTPALAIRDPYVFEFLRLQPREVMSESTLEDGLLDKLQDFLLELGRGFCFEARQRRILMGDEHFFVDLVFYQRILKCHVLVELKVDGFRHEYLGQLNTYVNWYREHEMAGGDRPPVGILLCAEKNHALVRYALAGMDDRLFVSKYELQLPDEAKIRAFLEAQYRELRGGETP